MSAPARPRPRPRARAKPSGSSESTPLAPSAAGPGTTSKTIITVNRETLTASGKTVEVPAKDGGEVVEVPDEEEDFDIFARRRNAIKERQSSADLGSEPIYSRPVRAPSPISGTDGSDDDADGHRRKRKRSTSHHASRGQVGGRIEEEEETDEDSTHPSHMGKRATSITKRDRQTTKSVPRARSISLTPPPQIAPIIPIPSYRPMLPIHPILDDDDDFAPYQADEWKPTSTGVELGAKTDDIVAADDGLAALIAKTRAKYAAETHHAPHTNPTGLRAGSNSSVGADDSGHFTDRGIMLQLTVTMRQDPVRAKVISERALKIYEKARVFTIGSKCPLDPIYEKLAEVLDKEKEDIILSYRGERIWSTNFTPERLKIYTDENLEGHEKEAWERTQQYHELERLRKLREAELEIAERDAERQALAERASKVSGGRQSGADGGRGDDSDDEIQVTASHLVNPRAGSVSGPGARSGDIANGAGEHNDTEFENRSDVLNITLRGKEGDVKAKAKPTTKMSSLVAHYRKTKKVEAEMGIELDGEILEGDSTVADADIDDGDMLSVVPAR